MKKLMSLVLALAMILSLAACGGKTTGTSPDSAGDSQQETPATSDGAFPEKQITIIMPWSLGGGPDTIARQVASYGEKYLGVPVIVENHTGGSGTIAMNDALQAEDDGYTMVVANGPLFSLTPSFINVNYTLDDITPLIGMRITEFVVLTNSKSGITNIDELKAYAAEGNTIKYATTGGPGNDSYGEALQQIHMVSVGGMAGMMGVHFRYGANVYVADDGTLTLSATERNSVLGSSLATNDWIPAIVN